jgi:hypothetical protein
VTELGPSAIILTVLATGAALAGLSGRGRDGFGRWLRTMPAERIGTGAAADVGVAFESIDWGNGCRVDVAPSDTPVFVVSTGGARTADVHVRMGNATRRLLTDRRLLTRRGARRSRQALVMSVFSSASRNPRGGRGLQ